MARALLERRPMLTQRFHLVARTHRGLRPFREREKALLLWTRLRAAFPERILAACLMPNHLHLVVATAQPRKMKFQLATQLRAFTRETAKGQSLWEPLPPPEPLRDLQKLETTLRYVHLNPCRARLTDDPWSWEFSTLGEHTGRSLLSWVDFDLFFEALRPAYRGNPRSGNRTESLKSWQERHEAWVLRDLSVKESLARTLLEAPDLRTLSWNQNLLLLERALHLPAGHFTQRGPHRRWAVPLFCHLHPQASARRMAATLCMAPHTVRKLQRTPLSRTALRILGHHARYLPRACDPRTCDSEASKCSISPLALGSAFPLDPESPSQTISDR